MSAMASSADISFRLIASSKKLLTRGQIGEAVKRAESSGSSLEAAVDELGFLSPEDFERIVSTRERHGRDCASCGDVTFMLPKQKPATTPCEHCQGKLILTAADKRPRGPSGRQPPAAVPRPAAPKATGRRIRSKAEREAQAAAEAPPSAAHQASQEAAAASASVVGDITFSAPPEDLAALRASAPAAGDPLEAATPPGSPGGADEDLDFRSMAYDPEEIAKAREEAAARAEPSSPASSSAQGPAPTDPSGEAPTLAPSKLEDAKSAQPQSAIGSPVKAPSRSPRDLRQEGGGPGYDPPAGLARRRPPPGSPPGGSPSPGAPSGGEPPVRETVKAPSSSPRDLRQQGGGFAYEPPEELAPRPPRRGVGAPLGAAIGAGAAAAGPIAGADTVDDPSPHDDDPRFAPRAEHFAEHSHTEEEVHVPLLREDIKRILKLPVEKGGIGMLVLGTLMVSVSTMIPLTPFTLLPALAFMAYPITFLIDCTRYGSLGRNHLPNFPDFDMGLIANLWRTIQVWFACAMPAIVILVPMFFLMGALGSSKRKEARALPVFSIGESAYDARRAEKDWYVPKGTDMSGTVFLEPGTDADVTLGGEWTVVGLLNRSNADDTMTTVEFTDMGAASALGSGGIPGFQAHDLDRVGRAMAGRVKVYATYADPDERIVRSRFPWLRPGGGSEEWEEEEDPDDPQAAREAAARDALDKAGQKMTFNRAKRNRDNGIYVTNRFQGLEVLKTSDWTFPGAFSGIKPLPVVYVLNAEGKVVMEYGSGVDDEQLYGDLENLMRGGDGGGSRKMLPPHIKPPQGFALASMAAGGGLVIMILIFIPLVLAGYFYWPAAQLIMVTFDSGGMAFNYPAAIRAIRAGFKDYLALVGIIVGLSFIGMLVGQLISMILFFAPGFIRGGLSSFVSSVFYFYSQVVGAYAIGRYYYVNKEAIGWFGGR